MHSFTDDSKCPSIDNPLYNSLYELDDFQKQACNYINSNYDVFCCVPTSSGKTVLGKYAILKHLKTNDKNIIIYTTPIKTLSNEKYNEFINEFPLLSFGLITGDKKINPNANIIIMTAEILLNILNNIEKYNFDIDILSKISCVIMDEIHFMNDDERGTIWEESIIKLNSNIQLIMLSATVGNIYEFCDWIYNLRKNNLGIIYLTKRLIPLNHYLFVNDKMTLIIDENNIFDNAAYTNMSQYYTYKQSLLKKNNKIVNVNNIVSFVHHLKNNNLFPSIIFSFSRFNCEHLIEKITSNLLTSEEQTQIKNLTYKFFKSPNPYEELQQYKDIMFYIEYGLAFHHSGLLPIFREFIEILFKLKLIKVLFATDTFATGVNTPTKSVVLTDIYKIKKLLTPNEYKQISGRAGRRGIDKSGTVILFPLYEMFSNHDIKKLIDLPLPITSKFNINLNFCLKYHSNFTDIINKSLYIMQNNIKINFNNNKINVIDNEINNLPFIDISDDDKRDIDTYIKLKHINNVSFSNKNIISKLKNPSIKLYYDQQLKKNNLLLIKQSLIDNNDFYNLTSLTNNMLSYLIDNNYLDPSHNLTKKGIIANKINECNSILLTEMLFNDDLLLSLDTVHLISLFGLFIEDKCQTYTNSKILNNELNIINSIITKFNLDVNINYLYVDLIFNWIRLNDYSLIYNYDEFIGDFSKNVIKLNNIINDVKYISQILNKLSILSKLEFSTTLLLKKFINLDSLYV